MADYAAFLADQGALRCFLASIKYRMADGSIDTLRVSDRGWNTDGDEDPPHTHWHRAILQGFNVAGSLIQDNGLFGGCSEPTFGAAVLDNRDGEYDFLADASVDGLEVEILMVGWTSRGERIRYTDAKPYPMLVGVGVDRPSEGDQVRIFIRSRLGLLEREAQPILFAPQCLAFPGSALEFITLGDVFDLPNGSWYVEGFFYCEDPSLTGQFLIDKTDFSSGWYVDIGTGGAGVIRAVVLGQSPNGSVSPTGTVKPRRWTHFAVVNDATAGTRRIVFDGTTVISTSSVTGNAGNNAFSFFIGRGFKGRISYLRGFSGIAPSDAAIRSQVYLPRTGTEASLLFDLRLDEGMGTTIHNSAAGGAAFPSAVTTEVRWVSSAWIGANIAGKHRRQIIGEVRDVKLEPRDPAKLIFEAGIGPLWGITPYSMANALAGATYTNDLARGITTLQAGTTFGQLTADVSGISPLGPAFYLDGSDDYGSATVSCPAGSMSLVVIAETRSVQAATRGFAGWRNGTAAGRRTIGFSSATNQILWRAMNDAATNHDCVFDGQIENEFFVAAGVLDVAGGKMRLYINAAQVAETALTGTWSTVLNNFAVGRLSDVAGTNLDGRIDCVGIFNKALSLAEIEAITMRGLRATDAGLTSGWNAGTDASPSAANLIGGQPSLTLNGGMTYGPSRTTVLDIALYFLTRRGLISDTIVDAHLACQMLRDLPGQAGWVIEDDEDELYHLSRVLAHHGAALIEDGLMLRMDIVRGGTASGAVKITQRQISADPVEGVPIHRAFYGVSAGYRRTYEPYKAEDVAPIAASDPARYQTATEPYQWAPQTDASILEHFPGAEVATIETALLYARDADRLARLLVSIYRPPQRALAITVDTDAASLRMMGSVLLDVIDNGVPRWGGPLYWQVVEFSKEETQYRLTIWMRPDS